MLVRTLYQWGGTVLYRMLYVDEHMPWVSNYCLHHYLKKKCILNILIQLANIYFSIVAGPPVIKEQPVGGIVRKNDPYTLNCATLNANQIKWYHDGRLIDLKVDPSNHRIHLPNGSLFFLRVATTKKVSDAGTYWCVAFNSAGATRSRNATIQVASIGDDFLESPRAIINVIAGETLVLPCRPPKGTPEPRLFWLRNGDIIRNNSRVYTTSTGDLRFRTTKAEDSATYKCQAENAAGTKTSLPSEVTVMGECLQHAKHFIEI